MIKKIDHIGIVVKDLEKSRQIYEKELHLEFVRQEQNPAFNVDIVFFRCGEVLKGLVKPTQCPLFGKVCTPNHAVGSCMVSVEGTCAAWYKYGARTFHFE